MVKWTQKQLGNGMTELADDDLYQDTVDGVQQRGASDEEMLVFLEQQLRRGPNPMAAVKIHRLQQKLGASKPQAMNATLDVNFDGITDVVTDAMKDTLVDIKGYVDDAKTPITAFDKIAKELGKLREQVFGIKLPMADLKPVMQAVAPLKARLDKLEALVGRIAERVFEKKDFDFDVKRGPAGGIKSINVREVKSS